MQNHKVVNRFRYSHEPQKFGSFADRYAFNPLGYRLGFMCIVCGSRLDEINHIDSKSSFWLFADEFLREDKWITIFCGKEHKDIYQLCPPL